MYSPRISGWRETADTSRKPCRRTPFSSLSLRVAEARVTESNVRRVATTRAYALLRFVSSRRRGNATPRLSAIPSRLPPPVYDASFLSFSRLASIRQRPVLPWCARVDCPPSSASGGVFLCCAVHNRDARAVTNGTRVRAVSLHLAR